MAWRRVISFLAVFIVLFGPIAPRGSSRAQPVTDDPFEQLTRLKENGKDFAYFLSSAKWKNPSRIFVCWEDLDSRWATERELVRQSIRDSWEAHSAVRFLGWAKCAKKNSGIRIKVADVNPHVKMLGAQVDGMPEGMVLDFQFDAWSPDCKSDTEFRKLCIKSIAVHEFGHALGFAHEQNRIDRDTGCFQPAQGTSGDTMLTPYDPESVMNYCNPRYNNNGKLSKYDAKAVAQVYGPSP
jgi:hypothetical protein